MLDKTSCGIFIKGSWFENTSYVCCRWKNRRFKILTNFWPPQSHLAICETLPPATFTPSPDLQLSDTKSWSTTVCNQVLIYNCLTLWHQVLIYNCDTKSSSTTDSLTPSPDLQLSDTMTPSPDLQLWHQVLIYNCLMLWFEVLIYNCLTSACLDLQNWHQVLIYSCLIPNNDLQPCHWHRVLMYNCVLYTKSWPTELTSSLDLQVPVFLIPSLDIHLPVFLIIPSWSTAACHCNNTKGWSTTALHTKAWCVAACLTDTRSLSTVSTVCCSTLSHSCLVLI